MGKSVGALLSGQNCTVKHLKILHALADGLGYDSFQSIKAALEDKDEVAPDDDAAEAIMLAHAEAALTDKESEFHNRLVSTLMLKGADEKDARKGSLWVTKELVARLPAMVNMKPWSGGDLDLLGIKTQALDFVLRQILENLRSENDPSDVSAYLATSSGREHVDEIFNRGRLYDAKLLRALNITEDDFLEEFNDLRRQSRYYLTLPLRR